jgi:hypothetical protein
MRRRPAGADWLPGGGRFEPFGVRVNLGRSRRGCPAIGAGGRHFEERLLRRDGDDRGRLGRRLHDGGLVGCVGIVGGKFGRGFGYRLKRELENLGLVVKPPCGV